MQPDYIDEQGLSIDDTKTEFSIEDSIFSQSEFDIGQHTNQPTYTCDAKKPTTILNATSNKTT